LFVYAGFAYPGNMPSGNVRCRLVESERSERAYLGKAVEYEMDAGLAARVLAGLDLFFPASTIGAALVR
jgi:hypothetical protein